MGWSFTWLKVGSLQLDISLQAEPISITIGILLVGAIMAYVLFSKSNSSINRLETISMIPSILLISCLLLLIFSANFLVSYIMLFTISLICQFQNQSQNLLHTFINRLGDLSSLLALLLMQQNFQTFNFDQLELAIAQQVGTELMATAIKPIAMSILFTLCLKTALIPFLLWKQSKKSKKPTTILSYHPLLLAGTIMILQLKFLISAKLNYMELTAYIGFMLSALILFGQIKISHTKRNFLKQNSLFWIQNMETLFHAVTQIIGQGFKVTSGTLNVLNGGLINAYLLMSTVALALILLFFV